MPVDRRLVTLTAADGKEHDALLEIDVRAARGRTRATGRRTALVHVHGIMGNFLVGTLRFFPAPLARAGFPVLVLETRMADVGQLFGQAIFEDAVQDVNAAVTWLREQGFDTIVLSGYSSGATLATRYAATHHVPDLRALVCLGNPWGLPQSMMERAERFGARPPYEELAAHGARRPSATIPTPPTSIACSWSSAAAAPPRRPRTARSTPTAPGGTRAGPPPWRRWPTARSGRCVLRSCWCRAPTTRWWPSRRPSGWPRSPARRATST